MAESNGRVAIGTLIFVMATFGLDMFSTLTSSPQTTEINAKTRAKTLMKWVYLADGVALAGGTAAWLITGRWQALLGTGAVVVLMHYLYVHARKTGLESSEPGTEQSYSPAAMY